jgi:glucokinase
MRATIGVDIGATKIACGVLKQEEFVSKTTIPTPKEGWRSVLDSIVNTIKILEKLHPEVSEVGVGVPGTHDRARTEVLFAPNIHGFTNVPIVDYLSERLGRPVDLENDANAAGLAEGILGAARYASSSMFITISTGIGGASLSMANYGGAFMVLPARSVTSQGYPEVRSLPVALPERWKR